MSTRRFGWFEWSVAALAAVYLLQMVTPIRLDTDSVRYLMIAIGMADGHQVPEVGASAGYPAILAALIRIGLDKAWAIVFLNCLSLGLGLVGVWYMSAGFDAAVRKWTIVLTMLSFSVLRTVVMPNTEPVYFGISLVALAAMRAATLEPGRKKYVFIAGAAALTACAVTVRLVGIALLPPLLWTLVRSVGAAGTMTSGRRRLAALIGVAATIAVAINTAEHGVVQRYLAESREEAAIPIFDLVLRQFRFILRGLGVLLVNAPVSRLLWPIPFMPYIGLLPAALLAFTARRAGWRGPVSIYVASYMLILLAWPFYSERLWMPVIPLLILHLGAGIKSLRLGPGPRAVLGTVIALFVLSGAACLAYMTSVSLAGENFRSRYGFAGGLASPGHEDSDHNKYARIIIKRFDAGNPAWRTLLADPSGADARDK